MAQELRRRVFIYAIFFLIIWPVFSIVSAAFDARSVPYYTPSLLGAFIWAGAGGVVLFPDFLFFGVFMLALTLVIFIPFARNRSLRFAERWWGIAIEPVFFCWMVLLGITFYFPTMLNHPLLFPFHALPVWGATTILCFIVLWIGYALVKPAGRLRMSLIIIGVAFLSPLPVSLYGSHSYSAKTEPPLVLLGLDSLSQTDELTSLRAWAERQRGTWYSHAVPPGLVTNSVWSSILTMRPIHEHGAFQTFQAFPETPTATLLKEAQQKGYWTIGVFPDQLTSWVGSQAGFDEDRSGPLGWRHLVTFYVQNSSLFLPLVRPLFPHLPFSDAPPNHSGTFTYNVNRELNEIFSAHTPGRKTFVAAHLTYLHTPCFPKYFELSWKERLEILRAKVWSVKDRSFDWQDVHLPTDPFRLREWKIKRLLAAVSRTVDETQFLERGGSLILFSDHGDRVGLNMENFWRAQYHHVLFVTFGLPQRDPTRPISLLEIGALLGFAPFATTFPPVVELSLAQAMEWHTLIRSGHLHKDGTVTFDLQLLTDLFRQLRVYRPWPQETLPQISSAFNVAGKVPKEPPFSLGVQIKQALPTVER